MIGKSKLPLSSLTPPKYTHIPTTITAAQSWTFATILPLLIGDLIPNGHPPCRGGSTNFRMGGLQHYRAKFFEDHAHLID